LEQEIGFDTEKFGRAMKRGLEALEDRIDGRDDISDPQEHMTNILVERLYTSTGQKYRAACEIIVDYLVKRCDLFNATAQ
jgi:hypothetical protein